MYHGLRASRASVREPRPAVPRLATREPTHFKTALRMTNHLTNGSDKRRANQVQRRETLRHSNSRIHPALRPCHHQASHDHRSHNPHLQFTTHVVGHRDPNANHHHVLTVRKRREHAPRTRRRGHRHHRTKRRRHRFHNNHSLVNVVNVTFPPLPRRRSPSTRHFLSSINRRHFSNVKFRGTRRGNYRSNNNGRGRHVFNDNDTFLQFSNRHTRAHIRRTCHFTNPFARNVRRLSYLTRRI